MMVVRLHTSVFETFKMTDKLTGKAKRQRKIIEIIGTSEAPNLRTKVEIAKKISKEIQRSWKNSYSGVYEDIEKVLLPHKIIEEEGRIPLKRGPRLLQKEGTGYYRLTKIGSLLLFCIKDNKTKIDFRDFTHQSELGEKLNLLYTINPILCFLLLEKYASTRCMNGEEIMPITSEKISKVSEFSLNCNFEFIKSILSHSKDDQGEILRILSQIESKH